jgi:hypothetical protein
VYLYLLGRHAPSLRLTVGTDELVLARDRPLPLARLRAAAASGEFLAVDPWVADGESRAVVALWTYARDHERALALVPGALAPQLIVHAPVGAVLIWLLPAPYPETPADDRPAPDRLLAELAEALDTIPAGTADTLPVPVRDTDLLVLDRQGTTDPASLWAWAHETSEARRAAELEARRAAEADAAREAERRAELAHAQDAVEETADTPSAAGEPQPEDDVFPASGAAPAEPDVAAGSADARDDPTQTAAPAAGIGDDIHRAAADDGAPGAAAELSAEACRRSDAAEDDDVCAPPVPGAGRAADAQPAEPPWPLVGTAHSVIDAPQEPEVEARGGAEAAPPGNGAGDVSGLDERAELPAPLRRLLAAAAHAQRVSPQQALAEAVLAHGVAVLGTREAYALLGVQLTWKRADGLYALTQAREWRPITALPSRPANRALRSRRE